METATPRTGLLLALLLAAFGGVLLFRLGTPPLDSRAEERCDSVVTAMVASGDWLVPRHHGEVRLQKPPLFYWEASAVGLVAGRTTLGTLRLPSAVMAVLVVLLTFAWGRRLGGDQLGLLAAAALVMMQSMYALGRVGTAEMTLSLCCNAALLVFERLFTERRAALLPLFALLVALAILAKATAALMIVGLPIAVFLAWQRRWRGAFSPRVLGWLTVAVVAGFLWYVIVIIVVPDGWSRIYGELVLPVGVRTASSEGSAAHYGPPWEYLVTILGAAFPAVLAAPLLVRRAAASRFWRDDPRRRLLAVIFVSLFIAFSLIPQKQKHYLLPLLPSLALLLADAFATNLAGRSARARGALLAFGLVAAAAGLATLWAIRVLYVDVLGAGAWLWGGATLAGLALIGALLAAAWTAHRERFVALAVVATLAASLLWYGSVDIWQRQFQDGSVVHRPDYVAARWEAGFQRHPFLARQFQLGEPAY